MPDHLCAGCDAGIRQAVRAHRELYSMRIMNKEGEKILTILLNYDIDGNDGKPGKYYAGAVEKWEELRKKYADINGDVNLLPQ